MEKYRPHVETKVGVALTSLFLFLFATACSAEETGTVLVQAWIDQNENKYFDPGEIPAARMSISVLPQDASGGTNYWTNSAGEVKVTIHPDDNIAFAVDSEVFLEGEKYVCRITEQYASADPNLLRIPISKSECRIPDNNPISYNGKTITFAQTARELQAKNR